MSPLDWIFVAIMLLLAVRCLMRGFVAELLSVASYAIGLGLALILYKQGGALLATSYPKLPLPQVVAFIALFLVAFLLTRILAKALSEGLEASHLEALDKVLGFVLGAIEGLVAVSLILLLLQAMRPLIDTTKLLSASVFAKTILPVIGPELAKVFAPAVNAVPKAVRAPTLAPKP
jgi:membrane protein required for colicin V production